MYLQYTEGARVAAVNEPLRQKRDGEQTSAKERGQVRGSGDRCEGAGTSVRERGQVRGSIKTPWRADYLG